jgi:hypothetical protein
MAIAQPTAEGEIQRYLLSGVSDPLSPAWQGNLLERSIRAHDELRSALIAAVRLRETNREHGLPPHVDLVGLTRTKVEPMVRGLFRRDEQQVVLAVLERSVAFLTRNNVETILLQESFDDSAWTLANLYLAGIGAELLSQEAPRLVGFSQNTTCYVSPLYFHEEDRFADFIVHEAAHVFHNCKRATIGLPEGKSKVWLQDVAYGKRETFAYSCEAYARILELGQCPTERQALAHEFSTSMRITDDRVDEGEVARIVRDAVIARNGWKVILAACRGK